MSAVDETRDWSKYINNWRYMVSSLQERDAFLEFYNATDAKLTQFESEIEAMFRQLERAQISYLENV